MAKQAPDTDKGRDTVRDQSVFSTSSHSKLNLRFLATTTALNTYETSKYTY